MGIAVILRQYNKLNDVMPLSVSDLLAEIGQAKGEMMTPFEVLLKQNGFTSSGYAADSASKYSYVCLQ